MTRKNLWLLIPLAMVLTACDPNKIFGTRVTPPKEQPKTVEYELFRPTVAIAGGAPAKPVKVVSAGEKQYAGCASCHGGNGEGGIGPKLQGQARFRPQPPIFLHPSPDDTTHRNKDPARYHRPWGLLVVKHLGLLSQHDLIYRFETEVAA